MPDAETERSVLGTLVCSRAHYLIDSLACLPHPACMAVKQTLSITKRAVIQRINRKLSRDGQQLRASRSERGRTDAGDYYIVDLNRKAILATHCDLEKLGRKLEVVAAWERLEEEQE